MILIRRFVCKELKQVSKLSIEKVCELSGIFVPMINSAVISLYRAPCGDFNQFLSILSKLLNETNIVIKNVFIGGDFNVNFNSADTKKLQLTDLFGSYGLKGVKTALTMSFLMSTQN